MTALKRRSEAEYSPGTTPRRTLQELVLKIKRDFLVFEFVLSLQFVKSRENANTIGLNERMILFSRFHSPPWRVIRPWCRFIGLWPNLVHSHDRRFIHSCENITHVDTIWTIYPRATIMSRIGIRIVYVSSGIRIRMNGERY